MTSTDNKAMWQNIDTAPTGGEVILTDVGTVCYVIPDINSMEVSG